MVVRARIDRVLTRQWQVVVPFLVAIPIYSWRIGSPALWVDEAATANEVARSGRGLLAFLAERDAVLGPYYVGMHFWTKIDDGEFWIRLPSVIAMVVAVALVALVARRYWGSNAGLAAGLLFALLPLTSRYAQEARPYALAIALTVSAVWLLTRAVDTPRRRGWWAAYAVAVTALGLTHLVALTTLLAHPLVLGSRRVRRRWLTWLAVGLVAPTGLVLLALGQREQLAWISAPTPGSVAEAYLEVAGGPALLTVFGVLTVLGVLTGRSVRRAGGTPGRGNRGSAPWVMLCCWFLLPPLALAAVGTVTPVFAPRYLVVCTPALVVLAAAGLRNARHWQLAGVAVLVLVVGWPQQVEMRQPDGHGPDARAAAEVIARRCAAPTAVREGNATLQALPYYLRRADCRVRWLPQQQDPAEVGADRVWLVRPDWAGPASVPGYRTVERDEVSGLRLTLWER